MSGQELQKFLQQAGVGDRRHLRRWIQQGRFAVNGKILRDPHAAIVPDRDTIAFDGQPLRLRPENKAYFLFHKPPGVVSTLDDPQKRPTVLDFLRGIRERVYPVGRLDFHSEGLMLLTNDGELAHFILSPDSRIPREYLLKVKGLPSRQTLQQLHAGAFVDGRRLLPFAVTQLTRTGAGNSWLHVTIREGKKHILRNAFKYAGHPVEKLKRIAIGTFRLKKIPPGHWRELAPGEVRFFKKTYRYAPERAPAGDDEKRESPRATGRSGRAPASRRSSPGGRTNIRFRRG